ncbi:aspartate/glutamate racemase family protein [Microbacterium sp. DT81.1]|uniref:aspartate/glutamate racemase family protein n=1 Tax=Microbacterium sp. DT81.1 TaxID=3393413 RepID=UPI003CF6D64C
MTVRLGLLHTVPALAPRFDGMLAARVPGSTALHIVDAELLAEAVRAGVGTEVREAVAAHVRYLVDLGVDGVLVTCSSIGEATEVAAQDVAVPVVRIDTAMAERAVRIARAGSGRITVLATLEATLGPTGRLLERLGGDAQRVRAYVVAGALSAREAGDTDRHDALIVDALRAAAAEADVLVLAQASMAPAADRAGLDIPVLTSPDLAMDAVLERVRGR